MRSWMLPVLAALVAAAITTGIAAGSRLDGGNNGHENDGRGEHVRDRALGRPALLRRAGTDRRAEPDRRHEQPGSRVHRARRRPEGRQRHARLGHRRPPAPTRSTRRRSATSTRCRAPAIFTPGDNDWTDCDRPSNGGFNSLERLDHERRCSSARRSRSASTGCARRCRRTPLCLGVSGQRSRASRTGAGRSAASPTRR